MSEVEVLQKQLEGQAKTIISLVKQRSDLHRENHNLRRNLGLLEEEGYFEEPSLPLIVVGVGLYATPECEKHGDLIRFKNDIWRCEVCKTSVDLSQQLKFVREEFDGVVTIR